MDPVTGAVIIAGLTTVGKPTAAALTAIVSRILNPSADAVGEGLAAPLQAWANRRGQGAADTLMKAAEILHKSNVEPHPVPGRVLMPILVHSSLEEDQQLQLKWAALLANAAAVPNQIPPSFPTILSDLSPAEALVLDWIHEGDQPFREIWSVAMIGFVEKYPDLRTTYPEMMDNLSRLGLIRSTIDYDLQKELAEGKVILPAAVGAPQYQHVRVTSLGDAFVKACYPPGIAERRRATYHS